MHIPDGLLSPEVSATTAVTACTSLALAIRLTRRDLKTEAVPLVGVTAAFLLAAQTLNFPIPGGTSGHLLGVALAGALLGPTAGMLVTASVLAVQALIFADGGLVALGANITNMAVAGVLSAGCVGRLVAAVFPGKPRLSVAIGAGVSVLVASTLCALELTWSRVAPGRLVLGAMIAAHLPVAVIEGLATSAILGVLWKARPDLATSNESRFGLFPGLTALGLLALGFLVLSPWGSEVPDGLDSFVLGLGRTETGSTLPFVPFPDYLSSRGPVFQILATFFGLLMSFGLGFVAARWLAVVRPREDTVR